MCDCDSCRACTVNNELSDEARDWLVKCFANLKRRFDHRREIQELIQRRQQRWDRR